MVNSFKLAGAYVKGQKCVLMCGTKSYEVSLKDLNNAQVKIGDVIEIIKYPNCPKMIAELKVNGETIFSKRREKVLDESLKQREEDLIRGLPDFAKHLLKMLEKENFEFRYHRRLNEVAVLWLGYKLFLKTKDAEKIEKFEGLSFYRQLEELPEMKKNHLCFVPTDKVVEAAKAFLADVGNISNLQNSAVMHLPMVDAEKYGDLCQPRAEYIKKYVASL